MSRPLQYAVVTPVRNEADNLQRLAGCLAAQTAAPARWVIVDTSSTDETVALARSLAAAHAWIRVVELEDDAGGQRGGPIVRAFEKGLSVLDEQPDVQVKLDCDVSFDRDYFERLLAAFTSDPALGIASGNALELHRGQWRPRFNTGASVWGAARAYRRECLEAVRPLEERMGWDGIDEARAQIRGWKTTTLRELTFRHHRAEGARDGSPRKAWAARGRASHYMGYRFWYLLLRSLHHARTQPAALAMVWGYGASALRRAAVSPDAEVRARLRSQQRVRTIRARRREALGGGER